MISACSGGSPAILEAGLDGKANKEHIKNMPDRTQTGRRTADVTVLRAATVVALIYFGLSALTLALAHSGTY